MRVSPAIAVIAQNLRVDGATAEVVRAFEGAQVHCLLLKGASIAHWLYDAGDPRPYFDCDLLISPPDVTAAEQVLFGLGFQPVLEEATMPGWWREHGVDWVRRQDGVIVDLHRTIPGIGVDPDLLWLTLCAHVERIDVGSFPVPTLTVPGRALQLALHAAHHGIEYGVSISELNRAMARADEATWRAAAELAASLEATPAFATGLRLTAAGRALAARIALPTNNSVGIALRASSPPPVALGFDQLARAEGPRARLRILARKVVPPAAFMRVWSPKARRSRVALALAYAWRPVWLVLHAPEGFRSWRAARRSVKR